MRPSSHPSWILLLALLGLASAASAQEPEHASTVPQATQLATQSTTQTPDPADKIFQATKVLKQNQPELLGEAEGVLVTEILAQGQGAESELKHAQEIAIHGGRLGVMARDVVST
jgi:hypothetical protein